MRILIAEDDPVLADGLTRSLRASDYAVDCASDGSEADLVLAAQNYDLVILDLGLPKLDGFEILRRLRRRSSRVPVLVLTARDTLDERVKGLDLGADDYLTKPFDLPELEARVRALIRRGQSGGGSLVTHGALTLDTVGRRATRTASRSSYRRGSSGCWSADAAQRRVVNKEQLAEQLYAGTRKSAPMRSKSTCTACARSSSRSASPSAPSAAWATCSKSRRMAES